MIYIVDDDKSLQLCLKQILGRPCRCFDNVLDVINSIDEEKPDLIFLDVLLNGPDAFTLLNEFASYSDLAKIPIVLISNLPLKVHDFSDYGVVGFLDKSKMTPKELRAYAERYCHD